MPILLALLIILTWPCSGRAEDLTVVYLERPPYYFTENDQPEGFLLSLTQDILDSAQISATFTPMPPNRILATLQADNQPTCTVGWFRTPEREDFALFSRPIYRDKPIVVLTTTTLAPDLRQHSSLTDLFSDFRQTMAQVSSFSHGRIVDDLIQQHAVRTIVVASGQKTLPRLIAEGRATYMLIAPEEVETLLLISGLDPTLFTTLTMTDAPQGNLRYLMFNKSIPMELLDKINAAIAEHTDQAAILPDHNQP